MLIFAYVWLHASAKAQAMDSAISIDIRSSYHLGRALKGKTTTYSFNFKNTGKTPFVVEDFCTKKGHYDIAIKGDSILPGDSVPVRLSFVSKGLQGAVNDTLELALKGRRHVLQAFVPLSIYVRPLNVDKKGPIPLIENNFYDFGQLYPGQMYSCSFHIKNIGDEPLIIKKAISENDSFKVDYTTTPVLPGNEALITASFYPTGSGAMRKYIAVYTNLNGADDKILLIIKGKLPKYGK
jgi:archaellum component FlaG (FlaF/FlaG flagellin family)